MGIMSHIRRLNSAWKAVNDALDAVDHGPLPPVVYHYTSATGLHGIAASRSLYLTDVRFMNDGTELVYAQQLFVTCLRQWRTLKGSTGASDIERALELPVFMATNNTTEDMEFQVFAVSFCDSGDSWSHWQSYAQEGVAVGFDTSRLINAPETTTTKGLYKVVYDRSEQERLVERIAQSSIDASQGDGGRTLPTLLRDALLVTAPRFKHAGLADERERRLVLSNHRKTGKTRVCGNTIVPYVEVSLCSADSGCEREPMIVELVNAPGPTKVRRQLGLLQLCQGAESGPISPQTQVGQSGFDWRP